MPHGFDFPNGKSLKTDIIGIALAIPNPCDNKKQNDYSKLNRQPENTKKLRSAVAMLAMTI